LFYLSPDSSAHTLASRLLPLVINPSFLRMQESRELHTAMDSRIRGNDGDGFVTKARLFTILLVLLSLSFASFIAQADDHATYGPVKPGETIWQIAREARPDESLTLYQVMLGLLKHNPDAFAYPCNLNSLKRDVTLTVPSSEIFRAVSVSAANQAFIDQAEQWKARKTQPIACDIAAVPTDADFPPPAAVENPQVIEQGEQPHGVVLDSDSSTPMETTLGGDVMQQTYSAKSAQKPNVDVLDALLSDNKADTTKTSGEPAFEESSSPDAALATQAEQPSETEVSPASATEQSTPANLTASTALLNMNNERATAGDEETTMWQSIMAIPDSDAKWELVLVLAMLALALIVVFYLIYRVFFPPARPLEQDTLPAAEAEAPDAANPAQKNRRDDDCIDDGVAIADVAEKPLAWIVVMVVPIVLYWYLKTSVGLQREAAMFIGIASVALIMWMFSLVSDFIPALLLLLLILLFGLAPPETVLSGFASDGFLLAFSVLGLGAVVTVSGVTKRYTLLLIKHLPPHTFWYQIALFFTGLLFTPIVPAIAGRASIVAPILRTILKGCDEKSRAKASTMLYTSSMDGINYLSAIFLTSAPANFMIFGMLPTQEQQAFQFVYWMYAASLAGVVMLILYFIISALFFRAYTKVEIDTSHVEKELSKMGKMSLYEWLAVGGVGVLALGIATASIHKITIPVIAFSVLIGLLFIGALKREDFIKRIDWAFLFLLASLIGTLHTMDYLRINEMLTSNLGWLGDYMRQDFPTFVFILTIVILIVRLFIPLNSAILIFATALLPIAVVSGVNPWMIGFIILLIAETAFFAYQSPYMLFYNNIIGNDITFNERQVQIFRGLLVFAKLAAIYISLTFWASLGIL
jgi:FimV-like protein